ncbi:hypothetical protein [Bradyrhizobium sp. STM 3562]|uniref:hypothetical protein n=1 Tax=Bradyrhizobium sp. STM 3562 TaxID=578924 RepID=UPI00388DA46B
MTLRRAAGIRRHRIPLEQSLRREERMASWIDSNVEKITMQYLEHEQRQAA